MSIQAFTDLFKQIREFSCIAMSKAPEDSVKVSAEFQRRIIEIIADEEIEGSDEGKKCSNAEFAARVGVSKTVISNIATYGILPSTASLVKIADYTNKSLEFILAKTDDKDFEKSANPTTFHMRLLELIREKGIRIADITNNPNITFSRNSIHVWLKRKNLPAIEYVFQLARYFNVSPDYLLGRTDYRHN